MTSNNSKGVWSLSKSSVYDIHILMAIAGIGIIIKMLFSTGITSTGTTGPASAAIWGYLTVTFSLMGVLLIIVSLSNMNDPKSIFINIFPVLSMILVLGWLIGINVTYFTQINKGLVANEFYRYSSTSTIFVVFQLIVLFKYVNDKVKGVSPEKAGEDVFQAIYKIVSRQLTSISYVLALLNIVVAGVLQIIVQYFSTDG